MDEYISMDNVCEELARLYGSPCQNPDVEIVAPVAPMSQPVVQQIIQNQFNITQTGNGINVGHADLIEIRDGKVVNRSENSQTR